MLTKSFMEKIIPFVLVAFSATAIFATSIEPEPITYEAAAVTSDNIQASSGLTVKKTAQAAKSATTNVGQGSTSVPKVDENQTYKDGTYLGSATGFRGTITVRVTISSGKIAKIAVVSHTDDAPYFSRAKSVLPKIVKSQSTNVDTVSGATYSSSGLIKAVRNALSKAATSSSSDTKDSDKDTKKNTKKTENKKTPTVKPVDDSDALYRDGTYYGTGEGFNDKIKVAVIIEDGKIKEIEVVEHQDDKSYFDKAVTLLQKMVDGQTTNVDTVSGATFSSAGIIEATRNALEQAKIKSDDVDTDNNQDSEDNNANDNQDSGDSDISDEDNQNPPNEEDTSVYNDGTYTVVVPCDPDEYDEFISYQLSMNVTIQDDKIVGISDIKDIPADKTNAPFIRIAGNRMVPSITAIGTYEGVDTVSGATCSSLSILEGCKQAFQQALK